MKKSTNEKNPNKKSEDRSRITKFSETLEKISEDGRPFFKSIRFITDEDKEVLRACYQYQKIKKIKSFNTILIKILKKGAEELLKEIN